MGNKHRNKKQGLEFRQKAEQYRLQRLAKISKEAKWVLAGVGVLVGTMLVTRNAAFWHMPFPAGFYFLACGLGAAGIALLNLNRQLRSQMWPSTQCQIQARDIQVQPGYRGAPPTFHPLVYYTYVVNDISYTSYRIRFGMFGYTDYMKAEFRIKKYVEGSTTQCYYDPHKPEIAILERTVKFKWPIVIMLCAVGFFVLAIVV